MNLWKMGLFVILEVVVVITSTFAAPTTEKAKTAEEIAALLPLCSRNDPDLDDCIKNATITLKKSLADGMPGLSLPSLEPLKIPSIKLEQATETLTYKAVLMDVIIYGLSNYEFQDIKTDMENLTITATATFNHVYLDSEYMLMGNFQNLPVEGSGHLMANFTDNTATIKMSGTLVKRKDQFYFMNHDTEVTVDVGDVKADFKDLYHGSGDKSMIANHIVNEHSTEILLELKPAFETVIAMLIDDVAQKFFKMLPFDQLFPN